MSLKDQRLADAYYYLGTTLVEENRFPEAVTSLQKSISIRRDSSPVHYMLSVAFQRLRRVADQRAELETVLAFDPKHAQANYDLGLLYAGASQEATAAELFRIAADNAPSGVTEPQTQLARFGSASVRIATALKYRLSDPSRALTEARIAAALEPKDTQAVALVAGLWDLVGDRARSLNAWQRLLELDPRNADATIAIERLGADAR
jgi:Flp pilus assembly protein TadD